MTRWSALPVLVTVALYGVVGPASLAIALGLAAAASAIVPGRVSWPRSGQIAVGIGLFSVALIVIASIFPPPPASVYELRTPWRAFAGAALCLAVLRLYLHHPIGGEPGTIALALAALASSGGTFRAAIYPPFVVAFVIAAAVSRRASDPGRAPLEASLRARPAAPLALFGLAAVVAGFLATALPQLHRWAVEQIAIQPSVRTTGFGERFRLGSLQGMLESDRKVLRVRGEAAGGALLRGIVYDQYAAGRWSRDESFGPVAPPSHPPRGGFVEIELLDPEPQRYFLPTGAADVAVSSGIARVDDYGVVAPIAAEPATWLWYRTTGPVSFPSVQPSREDLTLPRSVGRAIRPLALDLSGGRDDPRAALTAIERGLKVRYDYSLEVSWDGRSDPVVAFLEQGGRGHCEYFASAMALMARTMGIPARVVAGYRVVERNPLGDHFVVRERDAHAWVEAWIPGEGWTPFDPTPTAGASNDRATTPFIGSVVDLVGSGWLRFLAWLDRRSPLEMTAPPLALIAVALLLRTLRRRRGVRTTAPAAALGFDEVCAKLVRLGLTRRPSDTPDALAERVAAAADEGRLDPALAREVASWLRRYAAHRYGGHGDEEAIAEEAPRLVRRLSRRRLGPPSHALG